MQRTAIVIAAGFAVAATLSTAPAQAQNARSFVSGHGLDSNACTLAAPCRTFAVAFTHTNAGGEIDVLDTAGYGPLTITHAISIVNDGSVASVLAPPGGNGITITANPSDAVSLRGLTIEGAGVGSVGIVFNTGQSLTIQNSVLRHFQNYGLSFQPTAASNLVVSSTVAADNGSHGFLVIPGGSGAVTAIFNRVEAYNNTFSGIVVDGLLSSGALIATVSDSVAARNSDAGFVAVSSGTLTDLTVSRSVAASNGNGSTGGGIRAQGNNAKIRIGQSTVTGNTNGWVATSGGVVQSYGDRIDGNGFAASEVAPTAISNK